MSHPITPLAPVEGKGSFKGVLLMSPWVTFDQAAPAMTSNIGRDVLDRRTLKIWSDNFLGGSEADKYNTPALADADWWQGIAASSICVLAGADEIFVDDIRKFVSKLMVRSATGSLSIFGDYANAGNRSITKGN